MTAGVMKVEEGFRLRQDRDREGGDKVLKV